MRDFATPEDPPFTVAAPAQQRVPYVFNSPHSGNAYPQSLVTRSGLTAHELRRSEDFLIDELFAPVVEIGAPLLAARFPRAWLDVNREPYELDPLLFRERLPAHANTRTMRVAGGLGTVPRLVAENLPIYQEPPSLEEGLDRVECIYRPYHDCLRKLIATTSVTFGYAVLVDCHSMPSQGSKREKEPRADIIIGDRYGTSCNSAISHELIDRFRELGYSVERNKPYAGGFITEHYGRPLKGFHAVQIEINRGLYMNESTISKAVGFDRLRDDIRSVVSHLVSLPDSGLPALSEAAE
ncbi:N-formylglutamate amidohydrolase [Pseudahrensia aquimaris]|uniref:N-formylglutamate amidohydrolase n=2 Tax=Pseudahrensia aquimaris TaxID=744461 RepID=A0ABW3FBY7_9HYPH